MLLFISIAKTLVKAAFASGNFKVDKLQIGSDKKIVGEFSVAEAVQGTTLTFKATDGTRASGADAVTAVLGAEYKNGNTNVTVDVDALSSAIDTTALVNYNGFLIGGAASAKVGGKSGLDVSDYNVLFGWTDKSTTVALQTSSKASKVTAGYYQVVNSTITTAAVAKFPLAFSPAPSVDVEVGLAYKAAADTTVNAKVNNGGRVSVSYAQVVSPLTKLTFASEVDAANIGSDDHKFGITLNITA